MSSRYCWQTQYLKPELRKLISLVESLRTKLMSLRRCCEVHQKCRGICETMHLQDYIDRVNPLVIAFAIRRLLDIENTVCATLIGRVAKHTRTEQEKKYTAWHLEAMLSAADRKWAILRIAAID